MRSNRYFPAILFVFILLAVINTAYIGAGGWGRLFWNIAGYTGLFVAWKYARLSLADIGLSRLYARRGLVYGGVCVLAIILALTGAYLVDGQLFHDPRYNHPLGTTLYAVLVLLPLKTVIFEELAFRGILPALAIKSGRSLWQAIVLSSLAFGLWHVSTAGDLGNIQLAGGIILSSGWVRLGAVVFTTLAGVLLCVLRFRSRSLIAPAMVHWSVNAISTILAALSWR
jgi:membrane protease YdiL (CAAX protease family)